MSSPKRRPKVAFGAAISFFLIAGAVAAVVSYQSNATTTTTTKQTVELKPVRVVRTDLSTYTSLPGSLGYGDAIVLSENGGIAGASSPSAGSTSSAGASPQTVAPVSSAASAAPKAAAVTPPSTGRAAQAAPPTTSTVAPESNTVTELATVGASVGRGETLWAVDERPRVLFFGAAPLWRDLSGASTPGRDIYALNQNLAALGFDATNTIATSDTFSAATTSAVVKWQADHGYPITGTIAVGQIIVLAGPVLIGSRLLDPGAIAKAGTSVLQVTVLTASTTVFSNAGGTVSKIAAPGTVVKAGMVLFAVDGAPVVALAGDYPITRDLAAGVSDGDDIQMLKRNLVALGFDPAKALRDDAVFDQATTEAVRRFEEAQGLPGDGVVRARQFQVVPDGSSVLRATVLNGSPVGNGSIIAANAPVLEIARSNRQVVVNVNVANRSKLKPLDAVQVVFPDATTRDGVISSIGSVAATAVSERNTSTTVAVRIAVTGKDDESLSSTPVDVNFLAETVKAVLAVPASALVALKEGGFAVQVSDGGKTRLVGVKPGVYSAGMVEVTGNEISESSQVMVPR